MKRLKQAVLYLRVSTADKQNPHNQEAPLRQWCKRHGYRVIKAYTDRESGSSPDRPQFQALMQAARRGEFDLVVFWSLDRFSREGIAATFAHLAHLRRNRIEFHSLTEPYFQTTGEAADLIIGVVSWVADFERRRRRERIKAGLDRARREGRSLGRRPAVFTVEQEQQMREMAAAGKSLRAIASVLSTSKATVARRLQAKAAKTQERRKRPYDRPLYRTL